MLDQQQTNLVDELSMLNPVLFASYKKTEEVAINHWYPGMTQSNGSVNSYPHVQGIIYQLSIVLYHPQCVIKLTDVELYLLLTSILLHDIGKVKQKDEHGQASRDLIKEHWAELKIESDQIQYIIQNICYLHDRKEEKFQSVYRLLPADEYIDRYGRVRPRLLGALLYLGDHMDNSYTRTISEEFTNHFRKNVLGVHFQPEQQMITTVIPPEAFFRNVKTGDKAPLDAAFVNNILGSFAMFLNAEVNGNEAKPETKDKGREEAEQDVKAYLDLEALLYLMRDTYDNDQCLKYIKDELYMLGMPIKKWMIECKGQLFLIHKECEDEATNSEYEKAIKQIIDILEEKPEASGKSETRRNLRTELLKRLGDVKLDQSINTASFAKLLDISMQMQSFGSEAKEAVHTAQSNVFERTKEALTAYRLLQICPLLAAGQAIKKESMISCSPCYLAVPTIEPLTGYDYCIKVLRAMHDITTTIFAKSYFSYTDICNYMREDPKNSRKVLSAVRRLSYLFQYIQNYCVTGEQDEATYTIYYNDQVWNITSSSKVKPNDGDSSVGMGGRAKPQTKLSAAIRNKVIADWTEEER